MQFYFLMFPFLVFEISQPPLTLLIVSVWGFMRKATRSHPLCAWLGLCWRTAGLNHFPGVSPWLCLQESYWAGGVLREEPPTAGLRTVSITPASLDKGFQFHRCVGWFSFHIHVQSGVLACFCDPCSWVQILGSFSVECIVLLAYFPFHFHLLFALSSPWKMRDMVIVEWVTRVKPKKA